MDHRQQGQVLVKSIIARREVDAQMASKAYQQAKTERPRTIVGGRNQRFVAAAVVQEQRQRGVLSGLLAGRLENPRKFPEESFPILPCQLMLRRADKSPFTAPLLSSTKIKKHN